MNPTGENRKIMARFTSDIRVGNTSERIKRVRVVDRVSRLARIRVGRNAVVKRQRRLLSLSRSVIQRMCRDILELRSRNVHLEHAERLARQGLKSSNEERDLYRARSQKFESILYDIATRHLMTVY